MPDTNLALLKAENPEAYKKIADKGLMLAYPVKLGGQDHRPDIHVPYHVTIKMFDLEREHPQDVHNKAKSMSFPAIDPKKTKIEPSVLKDRFGNDTYALKLIGPHDEHIKANRMHMEGMGYPNHSVDHPVHITVDKGTWDKVVASKATNAHDAGIEFGPAQLRQGPKVLTTYRHAGSQDAAIKEKHKILAASEKMECEPLEKGFKEAASAAAIAGIIGLATPTTEAVPAMRQDHAPQYSSQKMLNTISSVESTGGKFTNHRQLGGMHQGESAFGKYALTPSIIRETVRMNRDLKSKHKKAMNLKGHDLTRYMQDNPGLEDAVATRHLARLEHHFGHDPVKIGYAWLEGITGTNRALNEKIDINDHWHVKKIKQAYIQGK